METRLAALVGAGLLVAGAGLAAYALLFTTVGHTTTTDGPEPVDVAARSVDAGLFLVIAGVLLAVVTALAYYGGRVWTRTALAVLLGATGVAMLVFGDRLLPGWHVIMDKPFGDIRVPLLRWAGVLVLAGALLALVATPWTGTANRSRVTVLAVVVGVLVGGATVAVAWPYRAVADATTAEDAPVPHVPSMPSAERWRLPGPFSDAQVAGAGLVVTTRAGIAVIDGITGRERWHYRRPDATPGRPRVLGGGTVIMVDFSGRWLALDALTGRQLWFGSPLTRGSWSVSTATTIVATVDDTSTPYRAVDFRTGKATWQWTPPPDCRGGRGTDATSDAVIITLECGNPGHDTLFGVDGTSGRQLWRHDGNPELEFDVTALSSGTVVLELVPQNEVVYVDTHTGALSEPLTTVSGARSTAPGPDFLTVRNEYFHAPNLTPQWTQPEINGNRVAWLPDTIATVRHRACGDQQPDLSLVDRETGQPLGSVTCLPSVPRALLAAPGALVTFMDDGSLVGHA